MNFNETLLQCDSYVIIKQMLLFINRLAVTRSRRCSISKIVEWLLMKLYNNIIADTPE